MSRTRALRPPRRSATLALLSALCTTVPASLPALAQTSPARGPITAGDDMPLADYLGLLQQISPAAADGAKDYLAAYRLQCGRTLSTAELRQAIAQEGGDPVLMGLIRAKQAQDLTARAQLVRQIHCTTGARR